MPGRSKLQPFAVKLQREGARIAVLVAAILLMYAVGVARCWRWARERWWRGCR
jgi:hypothetical protein